MFEEHVVSFEFLDHTADIIIRATGLDLKEAFAQAALGTYEVMTDISKIEPNIKKEIAIESEDIESLLFDWIEHLLFLFDTEHFVSNNICVTKLDKIDDVGYRLEVILKGEEFDLEKHSQKNEVKAMTYSFIKIDSNSVEFTLDL